eukprot:363853-Chlamydomonas_euryale.AAC.5
MAYHHVQGHDRFVRGHDRFVQGHVRFVLGHDRFVQGHDRFVRGHDRFAPQALLLLSLLLPQCTLGPLHACTPSFPAPPQCCAPLFAPQTPLPTSIHTCMDA